MNEVDTRQRNSSLNLAPLRERMHIPGAEKMRNEIMALYDHSPAVLTPAPFPPGALSPEKEQRLAQLQTKWDNLSEPITTAELGERRALLTDQYTADHSAQLLQETITHYEARFKAGVETRDGIRMNFYEIPGTQGHTIDLDPRAIDAYTSWIIDSMSPFMQGYKAEDLKGIEQIKTLAAGKKMDQDTVTIFINADTGECFATEENNSIVKGKDDSCVAKGLQEGAVPNPLISVTATGKSDTRITNENLTNRHRIKWTTKEKGAPGEPIAAGTNEVVLHEFTHVLARVGGLYQQDFTEDFRFMSNEHRELVHPLANAMIGLFYEGQQKSIPTPMPITIRD
ncbi:hypothetical protein HYS00_01370 [Candidatus Microgenomates bacterium]|nr:hypothetical protein [Candidatus Microgenomates bacterium]